MVVQEPGTDPDHVLHLRDMPELLYVSGQIYRWPRVALWLDLPRWLVSPPPCKRPETDAAAVKVARATESLTGPG
jgi:hypothetical protein